MQKYESKLHKKIVKALPALLDSLDAKIATARTENLAAVKEFGSRHPRILVKREEVRQFSLDCVLAQRECRFWVLEGPHRASNQQTAAADNFNNFSKALLRATLSSKKRYEFCCNACFPLTPWSPKSTDTLPTRSNTKTNYRFDFFQ